MKRLLQLGCIGTLSGFLLLSSCERQKNVEAGNDSASALAAAGSNVAAAMDRAKPIHGSLMKVNTARHTFAIRAENGMVQTFVYDVLTTVNGLPPAAGVHGDATSVRRLNGKAGSELVVQWRDENGAKLATAIEVTHVHPTRNSGARLVSGTTVH